MGIPVQDGNGKCSELMEGETDLLGWEDTYRVGTQETHKSKGQGKGDGGSSIVGMEQTNSLVFLTNLI